MSLLHNPQFRRFWAAQTVSMFGINMSRTAIPLLAAVELDAGPLQMGLIQMAQTIAFLVVGLPAGVLVDRSRRRPIMIVCELVRVALALVLVVGFAAGRIELASLLTLTLAIGVATAFFEVAYQSYIPSLVGRERLIEGNAKLESTNATSRTAGPALGGLLVQVAGGAGTIGLQTASHLASGLLLARISTPEPAVPRAARPRMLPEILGGLRFLLGHRLLRILVGSAATYNFFYAMSLPMITLLLVDELDLSGTAVGVLMAVSGVGGVLGAASAEWLARRVGHVRVTWLAYLCAMPTALLMPLARPGWGVALFAVPWFVIGFGIVVYNVGQTSLRQVLCPDHLLGRMNASARFLVWGILPLGSLAGGALGQWLGVRPALVVTGLGVTAGAGWLLHPRLLAMRTLPAPAQPAPPDPAAPDPTGPAAPAPPDPAVPVPTGPTVPDSTGPAVPDPTGPAVPAPTGPAAPTPPRPAAPNLPGAAALDPPSPAGIAGTGSRPPAGVAAAPQQSAARRGTPERGTP